MSQKQRLTVSKSKISCHRWVFRNEISGISVTCLLGHQVIIKNTVGISDQIHIESMSYICAGEYRFENDLNYAAQKRSLRQLLRF